nr:hypothetical protein [uncultured Lichenicoccus sp.]
MRGTQPAASKPLAEIEAMVSASLFERLARGMDPNLFGEILIRRARSVLIELEGAAKELAATRAGAAGQVSIGALSGPATGPVMRATEGVRQTRPGMSISVQVETSGPLVARLLGGAAGFRAPLAPAGSRGADLAALGAAAARHAAAPASRGCFAPRIWHRRARW